MFPYPPTSTISSFATGTDPSRLENTNAQPLSELTPDAVDNIIKLLDDRAPVHTHVGDKKAQSNTPAQPQQPFVDGIMEEEGVFRAGGVETEGCDGVVGARHGNQVLN